MIRRLLNRLMVRPGILAGRAVCRLSPGACQRLLRWLHAKGETDDSCGCASRARRIMLGVMGIAEPEPMIVVPKSPLRIPAGGFSVHTNILHMREPVRWSAVAVGCAVVPNTGEITGTLPENGMAWARLRAVDADGRRAVAELAIVCGTPDGGG